MDPNNLKPLHSPTPPQPIITSSTPISQNQPSDNPLKAELKWYEWIICAVPFLLIIVGGLVGGLIGGLAFSINLKIIKSQKSTPIKFLLILGIFVLAVGVYFTSLLAMGLIFKR